MPAAVAWVSLGRVTDALLVIVPVEHRLVGAEMAVWFGVYRLGRRSIDNAVVVTTPFTVTGHRVDLRAIASGLPSTLAAPTERLSGDAA